jgi:hypothetical protein
MTQQEFEKVVNKELEYVKALLLTKGKEYSLEEDRLIAFKRAAALQNETPKQALCGMLAKHIVSVYDMCMSDDVFSLGRWSEKITDSINYLLILKAIVEEEQDEQN